MSAMSGHRYVRRTHSALRQLQKLRELEVEFNIKDTATLVSAYNEARTSHKHYDELLYWIRRYIQFIREKPSSECYHDAVEFAQLAKIVPTSSSERVLLKDAFNTLCHKIRSGDDPEGKFIEALSSFLLAVDYEAFASDPYLLSEMARHVMKKLGTEQTFSRGTYPTHSRSLIALQSICVVIRKVDQTEFEHDKQEGLYQTMNRCLQNIIDSQSYYPFYYQATLTQQSLAFMDSSPNISSKEMWHRLLCAVKGTLYTFQALAGAICMNFAFDSFENGIKHWMKACTGRRIKQNSWFENARPLVDSRILVLNDPEKLDIFDEYLTNVEEIQDETTNKGDQKALRFAMIHEVTFLALDCQDEGVREWAVRKLSYFGKCCAPQKGWARDSDILEELVSRVLEVRKEVEFYSDMERVIRTINFHVRSETLEELTKRWEKGALWREVDEGTSTSKDISGCESMFNKIKQEMLLNDSVPTRVDTQHMLKKHYHKHSKVPSLFENEPSRHVNALKHYLMLHEKVFAPNGQAIVETRPIPLEDLFKNRQVNSGTFADKVKRVLLFGNPGTGKTTVAKKIAYKWSIDQWGDAFDMLYLIPVRELSSIKYDDSVMRKQRNLETAVTNICFFGKDDGTYEALRLQVKEDLDKERTLVVFDGLDEGEAMTKDMIESTESKSCRVMVLSRPQNLHSERNLALASVEVECMGLSDEHLVEFIELECSSHEQLVEYLQSHPAMWEIAHTPVIANILTFLSRTAGEDLSFKESSFNMFSLYKNMSLEIWKRYVNKNKNHVQRDHIFGVLGEIAFRALKKQHILIEQQLVEEYSQDLQTSNVLKDSGFLLLKKECFYYQFPHLSFQEFFAGQYMAHSLLSKDDEEKHEAIEFLKENKYCANFKQVFCFMIQALTLKKREEGYLEVETIVNAGPTALGYQQHLLLSMELLEASLSASRQEVQERTLDSTDVLDRAFDWIECRECDGEALLGTMYGSKHNSALEVYSNLLTANATEEFNELFVCVTKVARYIPAQWKKAKEILDKDLNDKHGAKTVVCLVPLMKAIPEEKENLMKLYWALMKSPRPATVCASLSHLTNVARLMPSSDEQVFERYRSIFLSGSDDLKDFGFMVDYAMLAALMPNRWQDILEIIKTVWIRRGDSFDNKPMTRLGRLAEFVPESISEIMDLVRELTFLDGKLKKSVIGSCPSLIKAVPEKATEIVSILWTLCKEDEKHVAFAAKQQVIDIMLSWSERTDAAVDMLLELSTREPNSDESLLVRLIAIAFKLIEETPEVIYRRLKSSVHRLDLVQILFNLMACIHDSIGTKTRKEMGLHWLLFVIFELVHQPEGPERFTMLDVFYTTPNFAARMSAKLISAAQLPRRDLAPGTLCKLAFRSPEDAENLSISIDQLSQDEDEKVATEACIQMFSLLEKFPNRAEKVMNSLQESLQRFECLHFLRMKESVSLGSMLEAYMMCHNDFLIFWIVWLSFDTPITIETRRNGKTELIVQTASNDKKKYRFQTTEEAEEFALSFDECLEVVFPDVASLVPRLDSQERQRRQTLLFVKIRERFTVSVLGLYRDD